MFHVICDLPNASDHISGVKFKTHREPSHLKHRSVVTHEPVEAEIAARFKGIPGFQIVDADSLVDPNAAPKRGRGRPSNAEKEAAAAGSDAAPDGDGQ